MELTRASQQDLRQVMSWFEDVESARRWAGPALRWPMSLERLLVDVDWNHIDSWVAPGEDGSPLGFGQVRRRADRCHLARLAVAPSIRGRGLGRRFVELLMERGESDLEANAHSLFVMQDNAPAVGLYGALGFEPAPWPVDTPPMAGCLFLVCEGRAGRGPREVREPS